MSNPHWPSYDFGRDFYTAREEFMHIVRWAASLVAVVLIGLIICYYDHPQFPWKVYPFAAFSSFIAVISWIVFFRDMREMRRLFPEDQPEAKEEGGIPNER